MPNDWDKVGGRDLQTDKEEKRTKKANVTKRCQTNKFSIDNTINWHEKEMKWKIKKDFVTKWTVNWGN